MNIFHLIFSELLYLDPPPAFLCHEYITKDTKENYFICGGKKQNSAEDKRGCGRPPYYQKVLFVSIFLENEVKVEHFYQSVPWLAPVTMLRISSQPRILGQKQRLCATDAQKEKVLSLIIRP